MYLCFEAHGRNYADGASWEKRIYVSAVPGWVAGHSEKCIVSVAFTCGLLFWKAVSAEVEANMKCLQQQQVKH